MDRRKILILYASAGHGHEKAARAVLEELEGDPGVETRMADVLSLTPRFFGRNYTAFYIFMIKHIPKLWGFFYHLLDHPAVYAFVRPVRRINNALFARGVHELIKIEQPHVIVSTHFLPCEVTAYLKRQGLKTHLVTVITDFLPHEFWLENGTDVYAVASDITREELLRRGVADSIIHVTGIPVSSHFSGPSSKAESARSLGLDPLLFTVLMTGGGAGVGSVARLAEGVLAKIPSIQLVVVCGTNRALFENLSAIAVKDKRLKVYGFIDNMYTFMDAADIVVGKGGGLTVSESLAKGTPMIVFESVPGQESRNAAVIAGKHAGLIAVSLADAIDKIAMLETDRKQLEALKASAMHLARPRASRAVAELALDAR